MNQTAKEWADSLLLVAFVCLVIAAACGFAWSGVAALQGWGIDLRGVDPLNLAGWQYVAAQTVLVITTTIALVTLAHSFRYPK